MKGNKKISLPQLIKDRGRKWEIGDCYMGKDDILNYGESNMVVTRKLKNGKYILGIYLIDAWCTGIKDASFSSLLEEDEYKKLLNRIVDNDGLEKTDYIEVHNWIFGALEFAAEAGIKPHKDFAVAKYLLEDDEDENIPIIEYEFGDKGKYHLVCQSQQESLKYLPFLERNIGKGNFILTIEDPAENEDDEDDDDGDDFEYNWNNYPSTVYSYKHPEYPKECKIINQRVKDFVYDDSHCPSKAEIDEILNLDHTALRNDLHAIIMYEIGLFNNEQAEVNSSVVHSLLLLGEVGNDDSLAVVLETMRQNDDFIDCYFGDCSPNIYQPVLYKLAANKLDLLLDYMKEPGLCTFMKCNVPEFMSKIVLRHPERRSEIVEWYRELLLFYAEKSEHNYDYCDPALLGLIAGDLLDFQAEELLPEMKRLYDSNRVDVSCCGNFNDFYRLLHDKSTVLRMELDIYKEFEDFYDFPNT